MGQTLLSDSCYSLLDNEMYLFLCRYKYYTLCFVYLTITMTYSHTSYFHCNLIHVPVYLHVSGSRVGASGSGYPAFRFQVPHPSRALNKGITVWLQYTVHVTTEVQ